MTLEEISDRLQIQDLMVDYCYAIDNRDWDALDLIFTPDAIIDYTEMVGVKGSLNEIKVFLATAMQAIPACQHIISTSKITVNGDRAEGKTVCTNPMVTDANGHVMLLGLWYRDVFIRTREGWRIASRYEENCWRHNVPPGIMPPRPS